MLCSKIKINESVANIGCSQRRVQNFEGGGSSLKNSSKGLEIP